MTPFIPPLFLGKSRHCGRLLSRDGYAPVSFLMRRAAYAHGRAGLREESPAGAIDISMKTFHEWVAMREGFWLNDKNAVFGLSRLNPLPKNSAVNRSLAKGPAKAKAVPGVAAATPKPFKPTPPAAFNPKAIPSPAR